MKRSCYIPLLFAVMALGSQPANASTTYGDLGNFDAVNDTGHECQGFEIELEGVHSTDISYTYDWNHYGPPRITDDNSDPAHPRVYIRYASAKNPDGTWAARTISPSVPLAPTDGHSCTDISRDDGCEHYGVGVNSAPTAVRYHWLCDYPVTGTLVYSAPVLVAAPSWTYAPPGLDPVAVPAEVVAVIPAPVVPIPAAKQFGEPSWVKVIKTTTHNANPVALEELISDDIDGDGLAEWQNVKPAEVETEFQLLQANTGANPAKEALEGLPDDMGDGSETVTRRYEFYKYAGDATTIDAENGEAMCDEVNLTTNPDDPQYLHGLRSDVGVTDANGDTQIIDCTLQVVVGDYIGAQMAGFAEVMPLGLIGHLQDGDALVPYMPRTVVVGGNSPYTILVTSGSLPAGLTLGEYTDPDSGDTADGVLFGTPAAAGSFDFTVQATDASGDVVSKAYTLNVAGDVVILQYLLVVEKFGSGSGTVTGNGIDCGAMCNKLLDEGTTATLTATPDGNSLFTGWGGACAGTGSCVTTVNADTGVSATFTLKQYQLTVSKAGSGSGTVTGNGINCGATCNVTLDSGTAVSLTATPDSGSVFTGWTGDCSGTGTCDTTMSAARNVTATFTQQYQLTVSKAGSGSGAVTGNGINCGATCNVTLDSGTTVSLTATPGSGSVFTGWTGDCSGTGTCDTTMSAARNVTATFTQQYQLTVSPAGSGSGTVTGNGINCPATCSVTLDSGAAVSLTATPASGSVFTGWTGDCSGTGTCNRTMGANLGVTATFVLATQQYTLTVAKAGSGTVTSSPKGINCGKQCAKSFTVGVSVTLTAKPANKHAFLGWSGGGCSGTALTCTVPMLTNQDVTARFN